MFSIIGKYYQSPISNHHQSTATNARDYWQALSASIVIIVVVIVIIVVIILIVVGVEEQVVLGL